MKISAISIGAGCRPSPVAPHEVRLLSLICSLKGVKDLLINLMVSCWMINPNEISEIIRTHFVSFCAHLVALNVAQTHTKRTHLFVPTFGDKKGFTTQKAKVHLGCDPLAGFQSQMKVYRDSLLKME